jgi:hypothetical protein
MAWSPALAVEGRQSPEDDVKAIQQISEEDVNRAARQYLNLDHAVTAIPTPQSSGVHAAAKGYGGRESFPVKHTTGVKLPEWESFRPDSVSASSPEGLQPGGHGTTPRRVGPTAWLPARGAYASESATHA